MVVPGGLLDVAIGLVVVYVVMSLLCSSVNEGIESFLKMRSRQLERGIREILNDPDGSQVTHLLYNHPLICGLFQGKYDPGKVKKGQLYSDRNLPSYIPSANFALAILDIILPATATQRSGAAAALGSGSEPEVAQALRQAALNFPIPAVGKSLTVLIDASSNDLTIVRKAIEKWFDTSMDRVSGWYKRRTQNMLFALALGVAVVLNVDTVRIVDRLLTDPALRNSLVSTAQEYAHNGSAQTAGANQTPGTNWLTMVETNESKLQQLGVPIGWNQTEDRGGKWFWLLKIVGILASTFATTLGAPFWFDVLNRFVVIRSTIKPEEKSLPEPSKD